jgi:ABC-type spermidine/putrescine transport system permease subunit II
MAEVPLPRSLPAQHTRPLWQEIARHWMDYLFIAPFLWALPFSASIRWDGRFSLASVVGVALGHEMLEAAAIDGASVFGSFMRIVLPLIVPGMAVLAILDFVQGFNDFLGPLLILSDPRMITAPLALANFKGATIIAPRDSLMFAGSTLATIPLLIIFFAFQRQLISGIMSGAVKG